MRVVWVFAPLVTFAVFVALRALAGRPLTRRALDIGIALLLLAYLTVTAGLGIFWVARMDLPVFDWHYLFGYALIVLAAAHVSLQLRGLVRFFRVKPERGQGTPRAAGRVQPGGLTALVGVLGVVAAGALLLRPPAVSLPPLVPASAEAVSPADATNVVDWLYRESSYSRRGLLRSPGLVPQRPSEIKKYSGRPRRPLPPAPRAARLSLTSALQELRARGRSTPVSAPTRESVSAMLFHANGVTATVAGFSLRAAASSGALYPTDVYLLADGVQGLDAGAYYYDGTRHELVDTASARAADVKAALADVPGLTEAPLLFVFGSTFDRTAWKYTVRTYRYLGLDAGHVALNLALAGAAVGLPCRPLTLFDDAQLGAALAFEQQLEAPLLVLACGGRGAEAHPPVSPRRRAPALPSDAGSAELTRLSSALTSWTLTGGFDWLQVPAVAREPGARRLEAVEGAERDVFELIRERRSFREFASRAVLAAELAGVLADASSVLGWMRSVPFVELFVAVRSVEGIPPGTYRYDRDQHALSGPLREGKPNIEAAGLDQALLGGAAFVIAWALLDERAGTVEGARDFRHALLDAGFSGEAAYLSATARNVGICGVGAFYDDELNALFASGGRSPRIVYLAGVGARTP